MNTFTTATTTTATTPYGDATTPYGEDLWWNKEAEEEEFEFRFLQETSTNSTSSSSSSEGSDSQILRNTFLVYGTTLVVVLILFCYLRLKFPHTYNLRSGWIENLKSPVLAQSQHGYISWIWKLYMITDDELHDECGMDALCLVRIMQMGYRLCVVGMFNAIWLMPLYATSEESPETASITDPIVKMTTANVPSGSLRLIGTALAAYVLFGYAMYQIIEDFQWFIEMRHKFLRKPLARNYTIFVRNIPPALRSNQMVEEFFRGCFPHKYILEANLPMQASNLAKLEAKRDVIMNKLERAIAIYQRNPTRPRPTHMKDISIRNISSAVIPGVSQQKVDSIDAYQEELRELNRDVSRRITELESRANGTFSVNTSNNKRNGAASSTNGEADVEATNSLAMMPSELAPVPEDAASLLTNDDSFLPNNNFTSETLALTTTATKTPTSITTITRAMIPRLDNSNNNTDRRPNAVIRAVSTGLQDISGKVSNITLDAVDDMQGGLRDVTGNIASTAVNLLALNNEDGQVLAAGFVTFSKLSTTNAAKQMMLHPSPFAMEVVEAPDPPDIYWPNVNRSHKDLQLGMLSSLAMTTALCLFWTIPMAFVSSLSSVAALRLQIPSLDDLLNRLPFLEPILEILAPLMVVVLNGMLPAILEFITLFEGPISSAMVAASLFVKLSAFMIIQTFFINVLSGGIFQELHNIIEDPASLIDLLATSLPSQATYFCQIIFVITVTATAMELLRVIPVILALLRQCIGPRLTEKERQTAYMGLRPLCDPSEFPHADYTSQTVLYFMVILVYAVISPITSFVTGLCFLIMGSLFRHQFVYIYPTTPDSGGKIWMGFIRTLLPCLIVAQITIVGLLALKKSGIATALFIPLMIITILFSVYINQMHFRVAEFLPTREALKEDLKRRSTGSGTTATGGPDTDDFDFLRGAYKQPELAAEKEVAIPSVVTGFYSNTNTTATGTMPSSYYLGAGDALMMEQETGGVHHVPSIVYEDPLGDGQQQQQQRQLGNETGADHEGEAKNNNHDESSQSVLSSVWGMSFFSQKKGQ